MNKKYKQIVDFASKYRSVSKLPKQKVGVAIIDTGVFLHSDISKNVILFYDCVNGLNKPYDDNGHGTHISGIVAAMPNKKTGSLGGINPNANIIGIKALNKIGAGRTSYMLDGFDFVIRNKEKYNIRIINISVGGSDERDDVENLALIQGVEEVWKSGIVVVTAAGNNGPSRSSVTSPGVSRKVITVGASDDISSASKNYSGRGPTYNCVIKPDILCTGKEIVSLGNYIDGYSIKSGTSMATPIVTGAISLLLEKYPDMNPKDVKIALKKSARDLGLNKNIQGFGELDIISLLS